MISKKIVLSMLLSIATSSLYGMLSCPGYGMLSYPDVLFAPRQSDLFLALYRHDAEKVKNLISEGADVNEKDSKDIPFLWQLIDQRNHFKQQETDELIDLLIEKGVNVNFTVGLSQKTVLHKTAGYGLLSLFEKLIQAGANINAKDKYGNLPLINELHSLNKIALKHKQLLGNFLRPTHANHHPKIDKGLHVVLRCFPGPVKQSEDKKDVVRLTLTATQ